MPHQFILLATLLCLAAGVYTVFVAVRIDRRNAALQARYREQIGRAVELNEQTKTLIESNRKVNADRMALNQRYADLNQRITEHLDRRETLPVWPFRGFRSAAQDENEPTDQSDQNEEPTNGQAQ